MAQDAPAPTPPPGPSDSAERGPSFEASVERLGAIVAQMERGELPLEQALALFEEGMALAKSAQARLDEAERRLEELVAVDADGTPRTRPFEG